MDHGQLFVLGIIAISMIGGLGNTWVRARHGLPDERRQHREQRRMMRMQWRWGPFGPMMPGGDDDLDAERKIRLLSDENEKLVGKIGRLEGRLAVLERIATDPAERTAREIEALRDR